MESTSILRAVHALPLGGIEVPSEDTLLSEHIALRIAGDAVVDGDDWNTSDYAKLVVSLSPMIVEIVKAVEERLLRSRRSSVDIRRNEREMVTGMDTNDVGDARSLSFCSVVIRVLPHLKCTVEEILFRVREKRGPHAVHALIAEADNAAIWVCSSSRTAERTGSVDTTIW